MTQPNSRVNVMMSFLLRKVDYPDVIRKYHQSFYSNMTLPESDEKTKKTISSSMSHNPIQTVFNPLSLGSMTQTSGDRLYKDIQGNTLKEGKYNCQWDRQPFYSIPWGIPIRRLGECFFFDGCFCSPQCALAAIRQDKQYTFHHRNPLYVNSEPLLRYICHQLDPSKTLIPANDFKIIRENGGSMDIQDYRRYLTEYSRTNNYIMSFVKFEYNRLR